MKKIIIAVAGISVLAISGSALAAESGFYGAFDLGQSTINPVGATTGIAFKKTDTAFRLGAGYQINKNFGVEANYTDFGKLTGTATVLGLPVSLSSPGTGYGVAVMGTLPMTDSFAFTGKVGIESVTFKTNVSVIGLNIIAASASKTNATFGVGIKYNLTPTVALRAQYEDFGTVGDANTTGEAKLSLISAGITFGF